MAKGITFFSKLSSVVANSTFFIKNADFDEISSRVVLKNTDEPVSGVQINNVQRYINELGEVSGITEADASRLDYSSENYIADNDSQKTCIEKLDAQALVNQNNANSRLYRTANDFTTFAEKVIPVQNDFVLIEDSENAFAKKKLKLENMIGNSVGFGEVASGVVNGVNKDFTITKAPSSDESIIVFVNGNCVEDQFSYNLSVITLVDAPVLGQSVFVWYLTDGSPSAPITVPGTQNVNYVEITALMITNKELTLPNMPAVATNTMVDIIGGSTQHYGVDFTVSGSVLTWNGLGLEIDLIEGSFLRINYLS